MKKLIMYAALAAVLLFASCTGNDNIEELLEAPSISELKTEYLVKQGAKLELEPTVTNDEKATYLWTLNSEEVSKDKKYIFSPTKAGDYNITLTVANSGGKTSKTIAVSAYPKYKYGAFVLAEGNMTNETGTLSFIDSEGIAEDSIFIKANDGKKLGNSAQDMAIANGNLYIISQNGARNDGLGRLVIADAETAKLKAVIDEGFGGWTTNIAVPNDKHAFVVQSGGPMFIVDLAANKVTGKVETNARFNKMRMVVIDNNVYAAAGRKLVKVDGNSGAVLNEVELEGQIAGLTKTHTNELKVLVAAAEKSIWTISKESLVKLARANLYDTSVSTMMQQAFDMKAKSNNAFYVLGNKGWSPAVITYSSMGEGREIFSLPSSDFPDAGMFYGPFSVNPETGNIYFGYVKGYSMNYLTNGVAVISPDGKKIMDYNSQNTDITQRIDTRFCAGIYFTHPFSPKKNN